MCIKWKENPNEFVLRFIRKEKKLYINQTRPISISQNTMFSYLHYIFISISIILMTYKQPVPIDKPTDIKHVRVFGRTNKQHKKWLYMQKQLMYEIHDGYYVLSAVLRQYQNVNIGRANGIVALSIQTNGSTSINSDYVCDI